MDNFSARRKQITIFVARVSGLVGLLE